MDKNVLLLYCLLVILILPSTPSLQAQEERRLAPVTRTYAIRNAFIVQAPGKVLKNSSLVIKDGLIQSVGVKVNIPAEAIIIEDDSLYVYAGFIDGLSHTGVAKSTETNNEKVSDPGNPPPDRVGITPNIDVRNHINLKDKSIEELRAVGFTTAHVVPYGRMLPGKGAIVMLGGNTVDEMIISPQASLYAELTPSERYYPNTVIAVMAKWRELYRQAMQAKAYSKLYDANHVALPRPLSNRILESFYPVVDHATPVLFNTPKLMDVQRALVLQKDLGFPLILGDVKEGWDFIPEIKLSGAKIFLTLDLPEEIKEATSKDTITTSLERKALLKRKKESITKHTMQPLSFQQQHIMFGFSCLTVKTEDIKSNIRRIIKSGLSEDQTLAALTIHPAKLLGLDDRIGSIDVGKVANLVISHKPYFHEKSEVRFVFVDGVKFKIDAPVTPKVEAKALVDITGGWTVVSETPQGKSEEKLTIKKDGSLYTGILTGGQLSQPIVLEQVEFTGNDLKYKYSISLNGQTVKISVDAVVEGETFKGTTTMAQYGTFSVEGKKEPN